MRIALIVFLATCYTASGLAAEPHPLAVRALASIDEASGEGWSYTRTTTSREGRRVEQHDATRPAHERWSLLSIDGKRPSERELARYRRDKADELKARQRRENDDPDIDLATIQLLSTTPEHMTFGFHPKADGRLSAAMARNVEGTLLVNRNGAWAERFELRNNGEIKPIPGVSIKEFHLLLSFRRDAASGHILPVRFESRIRGRAFLVKSLDDDRVSVYSDFVKVN